MIRVATLEDFDFIYNIWKRNKEILGIPWKVEITRGIPNREWLILGNNQGFAKYHILKKSGELQLHYLYVIEESRGNGIGRELIDFLKDMGRPILVEAIKGAPNNGFYESCGFVKTGEKISGTKEINLYRFHKKEIDFKFGNYKCLK